MKIRVEQLNPVIGDIDGNVLLILDALERAEKAGVDLLVLPEMILTGYPAQDLLEYGAFRNYCYRANSEIIKKTGETSLLFGTLTENPAGTGRKMFNSALLCGDGRLLGQADKILLPTYDVFDDLRYFEPGRKTECLLLGELKLGVTICEDIWYNENEVQYHHYDINPAEELKAQGAGIIINISASPFTKNKHENRMQMLRNHAKNLGLPVVYCNQTGAHTEILFDGDSLVMNAKGTLVAIAGLFRSDYLDVTWNPETGSIEADKKIIERAESRESRILKGLTTGIGDYLCKTGITGRVVVGLSGGIDSALVAVLACEALGKENVTGITMPSDFTGKSSLQDAKQLAENLGIELHEIPIHGLYKSYLDMLEPWFGGTGFGVAEENLQSRIRGTLLMAWANKFGHMLLTTGNKSELAVGYATLYGDMNGGLNPIGDLYKTEVFRLCDWLNGEWYRREVIPRQILAKAPSAELRPGQKDTDTLPEYEVLDNILWRYLELQQEKEEIIRTGGHPEEVVDLVLGMIDRSEFKRFQAPPVLKISSKSFGTGRRWPVVQRRSFYN